MKLDLKKTVLLFASIHILIAWVAGKQEKGKQENGKQKITDTSAKVTGKETTKAKTALNMLTGAIVRIK